MKPGQILWVALLPAALAITACSDEDTQPGGTSSPTTTSGMGGMSTGGAGGAGGMTTGPGGAGGMTTGPGGAGGTGTGGGAGSMPFVLTSPAFMEGAKIPAAQECTTCPNPPPGAMNDSPPLQWTAGPAGTMSYAIVMRDLDFKPAGDPTGFTHWVLWDIPSSVQMLPQDVDNGNNPADVPGAKQAQGNYLGPCSCNSTNTYQWKVHAIPMGTLGLAAGTAKGTAAAAVEAASIASTALSGES